MWTGRELVFFLRKKNSLAHQTEKKIVEAKNWKKKRWSKKLKKKIVDAKIGKNNAFTRGFVQFFNHLHRHSGKFFSSSVVEQSYPRANFKTTNGKSTKHKQQQLQKQKLEKIINFLLFINYIYLQLNW